VHGNAEALSAVVDEVARENVDRFVFGGDYAAFGPDPVAALSLLKTLVPAHWIRGNADRWLVDPAERLDADARASLSRTAEMIGREEVRFLDSLPEHLVIDGMLVCHGSPISDERTFDPSSPADDAELLGDARADLVIFGHSHVQFLRAGPGSVRLVNPGSVGLPFDGDRRAAYAVVRDDGEIELRRVEYDVDAVIEGVDLAEPGAAVLVRRLREARP
jgi:putative phosphoesterase